MVLQVPGESRQAQRKQHSGVREMWRKERKQDDQLGEGEIRQEEFQVQGMARDQKGGGCVKQGKVMVYK